MEKESIDTTPCSVESDDGDFIRAHIEFIDMQKIKSSTKTQLTRWKSITNNTIMVGGQMHDYSKLETP
ncbi:MAG: hypothetical protein CM15mV2_0700 [uncultured marine virus]|nr:MAG: hypothetical protein CM15mV2_0700 [uncultured marine virus]